MRVELSIIVAKNALIPGVEIASPGLDGLTFHTIQLPEKRHFGGLLQEGAVECAIASNADILVSGGGYLPSIVWSSMGLWRLRNAQVRLMTWGCQGYEFDGPVDWKNFVNARLRRRLHHMFLGAQYRRYVDGYVGYSAHTLEYFRYAYHIPADRLFVAENAVDTSVVEAEYRNVVDRKLQRKADRVVFVGRLIESKRIDYLIRAYAAVVLQYPDSQLVIVGDGPARFALQALVTSLGLSDSQVRFLGHISDKTELARALVTSGLFVLPGYGGLAINEAMAAGLAVICSRGDGTEQHLVVNGENGFIVPWGDVNALQGAMARLLSDPDLVREMGLKSFDRITKRFTLANMVNRYVDALQTVAHRPATHRHAG